MIWEHKSRKLEATEATVDQFLQASYTMVASANDKSTTGANSNHTDTTNSNNDENSNDGKRESGSFPGNDGKRSKRDWLAFHGTRHTRVGADYQVTSLPTPTIQEPSKSST